MCYRVFAFNASGVSAPASPSCVVPPAAPGNFAVAVTAPGEVELTWTDNSAVETSYQVWIAYTDPCCGICNTNNVVTEYPIAVLPANATRYRTMLASTECQTTFVFVMASVEWSARPTEYVPVPKNP